MFQGANPPPRGLGRSREAAVSGMPRPHLAPDTARSPRRVLARPKRSGLPGPTRGPSTAATPRSHRSPRHPLPAGAADLARVPAEVGGQPPGLVEGGVAVGEGADVRADGENAPVPAAAPAAVPQRAGHAARHVTERAGGAVAARAQ